MKKKDEIAVVMLSGGMDSTLITAIAKNEGKQVAALHLNYGQKTEARELKQYNAICDFYGVHNRLVVDVGYLAQIGGSSLTDKSINIQDANLNNSEIPDTYVPFRNANILSIATSWAEVIGANYLYMGAVEEDSSGYPDTTVDFFEAFQEVINKGTKPFTHIQIITPIISLTKKQIVLKGKQINLPFELTWSCYKSNDMACGVCDSCALRLRGFEQAGVEDSLLYQKIIL